MRNRLGSKNLEAMLKIALEEPNENLDNIIEEVKKLNEVPVLIC